MTEWEYEDLMGSIALKHDKYSSAEAKQNSGYVKGYFDGIFAALEVIHEKAQPEENTWEIEDLEVDTEEKTIKATYSCTRCGKISRNTDSECPYCHTAMSNAELDTDLSVYLAKVAYLVSGEHYKYEF